MFKKIRNILALAIALLLLLLALASSASAESNLSIGSVIGVNTAISTQNNSSSVNNQVLDEAPITSKNDEGTDYTKADYGASIVSKGADLIVLNVANAIGIIWQNNTFSKEFTEQENLTNEYGATRGAITSLMIANPHPEEVKPIKKFEEDSRAEWAFLICIYILSFVYASRLEHSKNHYFQRALSNYDLSENRFITGVFVCIASYVAPKVVLFLIDISSAVSKFAMLSIIDYIEPSTDNAYLYLMMMIGETIVAVPFIIRQWVLILAYAISRILIVLFIMGIFQDQILMAYEKFKLILALQPVCVFVACGIMLIIKWYGLENVTGMYIIMFLVIAYLIKEWLFPGPVNRAISRGLDYGIHMYNRGWRY
jgi:hypothetical protein